MATAPLKTPLRQEDELPLWDRLFDQKTRGELIDDDLEAGRKVCGVLITIVVGGLLLGIAAVLLSL
jgi:hypothetical protein